nr:Hypothetical protein CBG13202 [Haemonchus contortus]
MRLRHVNLEAHLHTNEKYETYFKRRIANIVSSYCEHQANECPGATLRITQTSSDASQSDDNDDDNSVLYAADDESEPLLTQNNVVLLRVEREPVNVTRILFAITKSENVGSLNEQMIIDPVKVKYILGSQAGPLARILGGIKLDSVRVSRIRRHLKPSETDNTRLITIISIVGAFFVICYIIGAIRLCRFSNCDRHVSMSYTLTASNPVSSTEAAFSVLQSITTGMPDDVSENGKPTTIRTGSPMPTPCPTMGPANENRQKMERC